MAGKIGGEKKRRHEQEAERTSRLHENSEDEGEANCEFAVSNEEGYGSCERENDFLQYRDKNGIGRTAVEKGMDPVFESAVQGELGSEYFVFAEDDEDASDTDSEDRNGKVIPG
jgi:hypothetical protein